MCSVNDNIGNNSRNFGNEDGCNVINIHNELNTSIEVNYNEINYNELNIGLDVGGIQSVIYILQFADWIIRKYLSHKKSNGTIADIECRIKKLLDRCGIMVDSASNFTEIVETNGPVRTIFPNEIKNLNTTEKKILNQLFAECKKFKKIINTNKDVIPEKIRERFNEIAEYCLRNALIYKNIISGKDATNGIAGERADPEYLKQKFAKLKDEDIEVFFSAQSFCPPA